MGGVNDNQNSTLLKAEWFARTMNISSLDDDFMQRICHLRKNLNYVVIKALDDKDVNWTEDDGILLFKDRVYVPRNQKL